MQIFFSATVIVDKHPNFFIWTLFLDEHSHSKADSHKLGKSVNAINSDSVVSPKIVSNCFQNKETLKPSNFTFHVASTTGQMSFQSEMPQQLWAWLYPCAVPPPSPSVRVRATPPGLLCVALQPLCTGPFSTSIHRPDYVDPEHRSMRTLMTQTTCSFQNWIRTQMYTREMKTSIIPAFRGFNLAKEIITHKLLI